MANHANIINCKKPFDEDVVLSLVQEFVDTRLKGLFHIVKAEKDGWHFLQYKNDPYMGMNFWLDTYKEYDDDENVVSSQPTVEFRHGHCCDLFWWIDLSLENFIAYKLEGQIVDESDGEKQNPVLDKYPTFSDYVKLHFEIYGGGCSCRYDMVKKYLADFPELVKAFLD